jgi:hypothetical protein
MIPEYEYRQCVNCEYIEDCPHPDVDMNGEPIPPKECWQKDHVKLSRKPSLKPNESSRK